MAKILLIEDNDNIRLLYERLLFDYEIVGVPDGKQAVNALNTDQFDLVMLDMHLAVSSGLDILRYIRESAHLQDLPVFAISSDDMMRFAAQDLGIQLWMTKPIDVETLLTAVSRQLDGIKV